MLYLTQVEPLFPGPGQRTTLNALSFMRNLFYSFVSYICSSIHNAQRTHTHTQCALYFLANSHSIRIRCQFQLFTVENQYSKCIWDNKNTIVLINYSRSELRSGFFFTSISHSLLAHSSRTVKCFSCALCACASFFSKWNFHKCFMYKL